MGSIQRGVTSNTYDDIGKTYTTTRAPDPRIGAQIRAALGNVGTVLNVGAGTGSYEPEDCQVVALEPSEIMVRQRDVNAASVVRGVSETLPFPDDCFDASMAVLTLHHWTDQAAGLAELKRVCRSRIAILTFDPTQSDHFWLIRDYLPGIKKIDASIFPDPKVIAGILGSARIEEVPIPADCQDGFLCAFWKRPEAYLDPAVRAGISCFPALPTDAVESGVEALARDLETGQWQTRNRDIQNLDVMDLGYRLIVADVA